MDSGSATRVRTMLMVLLALLAIGIPAGVGMAAPGGSGGARVQQHYCEARNGAVIIQRGTATCVTDGTSYAVASGANAYAGATNNSTAIANGVRSTALAENNSIAREWHQECGWRRGLCHRDRDRDAKHGEGGRHMRISYRE